MVEMVAHSPRINAALGDLPSKEGGMMEQAGNQPQIRCSLPGVAEGQIYRVTSNKIVVKLGDGTKVTYSQDDLAKAGFAGIKESGKNRIKIKCGDNPQDGLTQAEINSALFLPLPPEVIVIKSLEGFDVSNIVAGAYPGSAAATMRGGGNGEGGAEKIPGWLKCMLPLAGLALGWGFGPKVAIWVGDRFIDRHAGPDPIPPHVRARLTQIRVVKGGKTVHRNQITGETITKID